MNELFSDKLMEADMRRVVASVVLIFILVGLISTWLIKGYNQSGGSMERKRNRRER